jgi:hypothetical protein
MYYDISDCSKNLVTYIMYSNLIKKQFEKRNIAEGQLIALEWANYICQKLGLNVASNWKIFKKNLTQFYFGELECKRFTSKNTIEDIFSYIKNLNVDNKIRMSVHRYESSCHSKSVRIGINSADLIEHELRCLLSDDEIEIFPEASNDDSICFRRLSSEFGNPIYEVGFGQAMYVFENERGKHKICTISHKEGNCEITGSGDSLLDKCAMSLFNEFDSCFSIKSNMIYRYTGIEYLSIEGYYDYVKKSSPIIVDFDLPFDYIFMLGKDTN